MASDAGASGGAGLAAFEPIEQMRAHEYVAEQLRRHIGLHLVSVGDALPSERDLSAMFGVGRATVQAALRLLEAERIVETKRGRHGGTFVVAHVDDDIAKDYLLVRLRRDRSRISEALQFRRTVDMLAAAFAAKQGNKDDVRQIRLANERTGEAQTDASFMAHDTEFHLAIATAAHNGFVYQAVEEMRLVLNDAIAALPESRSWQRRTVKEHAVILEAIESGDESAASAAMGRHVAGTEKSVTALLAAL